MPNLLPYQCEGVAFAVERRGTLLADDMGLGKTVQAIGIINCSPDIKRVLVVCPKSLKLNWLSEIETWLARPARIEVVTYEGLAKLSVDETYDFLIVDEAHYVKNPQVLRTRRVMNVAKRSAKVLLLTGTPMENRPVELYPLLRICDPETWDPPGWLNGKRVGAGEGAGWWPFVKKYCDARQVTHGWRGALHWDFTGASNLDELRERLYGSCMLRRLKSEVLAQLPPKRRRIIVLPSPKGLDDRDLISELSEDNYEETVRALRADRVLFEEYSQRRHEQGVAKIPQVVSYVLDALEGAEPTSKVIVFAHHSDVVEGIVAGLRGGLGTVDACVSVTGKTPPAQREMAVQLFQNSPKVRAFVGSIGAAGVGLTLTAASHVVFAELDPVPGRVTQAEDRAHRIGQGGNVLVDHLVWDRSLDARICKILVKKQDVLTQALDARATG